MSGCNCTMAIRVNGDGCRHCQPQVYIDHLLDTLEEDRAERDAALAEVEKLKNAPSEALAVQLITQFIVSDAVNYHEAQFSVEFEDSRKSIDALVTLQDPGKPTAHEFRLKAEARRDKLAELLRASRPYVAFAYSENVDGAYTVGMDIDAELGGSDG